MLKLVWKLKESIFAIGLKISQEIVFYWIIWNKYSFGDTEVTYWMLYYIKYIKHTLVNELKLVLLCNHFFLYMKYYSSTMVYKCRSCVMIVCVLLTYLSLPLNLQCTKSTNKYFLSIFHTNICCRIGVSFMWCTYIYMSNRFHTSDKYT